MDWTTIIIGLLTTTFGTVLGVVGTVIYDRRFAKRPDLRYTFGAPATFGTGERERTYQNLEVTNVGFESTTDVRINFSRVSFDLVEHQVVYDGQHSLEKTDDLASICIPNLPPGDSLTISFVIPSINLGERVDDLFISARSKECIGKRRDKAQALANESWITMVGGLGIGIAALITISVASRIFVPARHNVEVSETIKLTEQLDAEKKSKEAAVVEIYPLNPVISPGKEVEIQFHIKNLSENPLSGYLTMRSQPWAENQKTLEEKVYLAGNSKQVVAWKGKVSSSAQRGKYMLVADLVGRAYDQRVSVEGNGTIEIK